MSEDKDFIKPGQCPGNIDYFLSLVREEICRAYKNHRPLNSLHEGYAVILEEVDELWDEVRKKAEKRAPYDVLNELIQIAAMAARTAIDTDTLELGR